MSSPSSPPSPPPAVREPRTDTSRTAQALILEEGAFNHVLRIANTNVAGYHKIAYALTAVKGLGRRFSHQVCKAADIDTKKRSVQPLFLALPSLFFLSTTTFLSRFLTLCALSLPLSLRRVDPA